MTTSNVDESRIVYREVVEAGKPWMHEVKAGQHFRIVDLEGNQAVDTLFTTAHDHSERYSARTPSANKATSI